MALEFKTLKPFTFILQWHLTAKCDQHCKHCYMYDEPTYFSELRNPLSFEDCIKIIDDYSDMINTWKIRGRINFTGGDPLLREDFFDILTYTKKKGIQIGILGNPYHINYKTARKLKNLGLFRYQVSIDGLEKTHDFLRRPGSFRETIKALRTLHKVGIQTAVMFTVSRLNASELIDVIKLVSKEGVSVFAFSRLAPTGSGKKLKDMILTPLEYKKLLFEVLEEYRKIEEKGTTTHFARKDHLWIPLYQEIGLLRPLPQNKKIIYGGCGIGVHLMVILANGVVYACRRFPSPIGKVPEQRLMDIFLHSKNLNKYRNIKNFLKCSKCELVQLCRGCPSVAYGVTKNPFAPDPQCWKKVD